VREKDYEMSKDLRTAKILYIALMAGILAYASILFRILPKFPEAIFPTSDFLITILTMLLSILAVCWIVYGFFLLPRMMIKASSEAYKKNSKVKVLLLFIFRGALFETVAIQGLILGILGMGWQISLPFIVVSAGALIITFPTENRWKKMMESINIDSKPE
jgi:hypothetical protein